MITKFSQHIFKNSPWGDSDDQENIFSKNRNNNLFDFDHFNPKPKHFILGFMALIIFWLVSGVYQVKEGERSIIMRFGQYNRTGMPGLNYHLPLPIEKKIVETVDQSRRIEIGYRSVGKRQSSTSTTRDIKTESLMLTGDENIIELNVDAMWHINDLSKYIFNLAGQEETVKSAAQSAIREVIGSEPITSVLSNRKQFIAEKIEHLIQDILDHYDAGVTIEQVKLLRAEPPEEVIAAYRDVQTAKADKEKSINESEAYQNDILPKARGQSAKIIQKAEGYKAEVVAGAKGNVARFNSIYKEYLVNKEVTRTRLYLENIEHVLKNANKVILGKNNMLPHMAIDQKTLD